MAESIETKTATDVDLSVARKIMAMLARAEDEAATENEKKIAREKAEKLMAENSLTRSDLENLDFEYREIELRYKQQPGWQQAFCDGLRKLLGVFTVYCTASRSGGDRKALLKASGRPSDLDQFEYLLNSITDQIYDLCGDWKKGRTTTRRQTRDFRMGCARRVRDRLYDLIERTTERQQEKQKVSGGSSDQNGKAHQSGETDMILLKEEEVKRKRKRAKEVMSNHTSWSTRSGSNYRRSSASRAGSRAGDNVQLNKGVSSGSAHQLES